MWNPNNFEWECNKTWKLDELLAIKKCPCEKRLFGKLVLGCEDEVWNTT